MKTSITILAFLFSVLFSAEMELGNFTAASKPAITLIISTDQYTYKLPSEESDDDWFALDINCVITNTTDSILTVVSPNAYRISPHPWIVKMNGRTARQWPGGVLCAPSFREENKLIIHPNQEIRVTLQWHTFIRNFEQTPGLKRFQLKYHLIEGYVINQYVTDTQKDLKEIESGWSNEIIVKFDK